MARSRSNARASGRTCPPLGAALSAALLLAGGALADEGRALPYPAPSARGTRVVTWPAPAGEATSDDYEVFVEGERVPVYRARVLDPPFAGKEWDFGGPYSFAVFDVSGPAGVRISCRRPVKELAIRPESAGIRGTVEGGRTIAFRLDGPRKLSVEPDGKSGPLLLFANPLEDDAPRPGDPGVTWFAPGVHKPERIELGSGETLYLAGGAVVKAEILVRGDRVRIRGRGILDGSDWEWRKGPVGSQIAIRGSSDVEVRDIVIRGSAHWTIVPVNSRKVTIRNVKLCNSRVQNDDGINPCNSQDVLITDCFIRSDDDCVALKGLELRGPESNVERIVVENSILWCDRARIFLLGHESRAERMRDVTLRNLDIIHFSMTAFLFEPGEDMRLEDVRVQDVRVHGEGQRSFIRLLPVVNQYMRKKVPGSIRDVRFERVRLEGRPGDYLVEIGGADQDHDVRGVSFEDVSIAGEPLGPDSSRLRVGAHAEKPRFAESPGGSAREREGR